MIGFGALIKRNVKLYFKDKGMFFTSLITPVILLVLYVTFLAGVFEDMFLSPFGASGFSLPDGIVKGFVGSQLTSSILAVSCVTVAFCSNLLSVQDKINGAKRDLDVSPVNPAVVAAAYFVSTLISSLIISFVGAAACLIYVRTGGWYLSPADIAAIFGDVIILVLFGTSLSSCLIYPMTTQGQASALGTVISAGYGFICGAYMPISSFSEGLQKIMSFLPGTYGTSLLREHTLRGVLAELQSLGVPDSVIDELRISTDCTLYFFGHTVTSAEKYAVICGVSVLLIALYIFMNIHGNRKKVK